MNLERLVRRTFRRFGLDVKRASLPGSSIGLTLNLLDFVQADIVFDVGANEGQFAQELLAFRPTTTIVSFEPASTAHTSLLKNARGNPNWIVAERMALGETSAQSKLYVTKNSQCSSLRPVNKERAQIGSSFDLQRVEITKIERFDNLCQRFVDRQARIYLKVDVQGAEKEVISGTVRIKDQIVAMQVEVSFQEIYVGQSTGFRLIEDLVTAGFDIYGISNGWRDARAGKLLQADAFFIPKR